MRDDFSDTFFAAFFFRKQLKLNIKDRRKSKKYIVETNVSDFRRSIFFLATKGYGSVRELLDFETDLILDLFEYENAQQIIETHEMHQNRR